VFCRHVQQTGGKYNNLRADIFCNRQIHFALGKFFMGRQIPLAVKQEIVESGNMEYIISCKDFKEL